MVRAYRLCFLALTASSLVTSPLAQDAPGQDGADPGDGSYDWELDDRDLGLRALDTTTGMESPHEIELAIAREHASVSYRMPYSLVPSDGYLEFELLATENEDFLLGGTLLRWSDTGPSSPWNVGIGISAWGGLLDGPPDGVFTVGLTGAAAYRIPTRLPMTAMARLSFAPDITSFEDADGLTEAQLRLEVAIDDSAVAFAGYRFLEMGLQGGGDAELVDEFLVGVRLGL